MIFNSFQFIWLFPLIFVGYWVADGIKMTSRGKTVANCLLLIISYGLYAQWSVPFSFVLFGVTLITYGFARLIEAKQAFGKKKYLIWAGVLLTLLPLLIFKYFNFITQAGASALAWIGIDTAPPGLNWVVPLGLSFYTFQALGYLWDVYYRKIHAEKNFLDYMLFVAFFPQILCGPISKADELIPQIKAHKPFNYNQAVSGLRWLLWGMFLKVVFADRLGVYVDTIFADPLHFSGSSNLIAAIFFSFQIYGDFAGYSFMALGVAKLMGYDIIKNFNRPYFSTSVSMFWKRWNISLTRWLTNFIYFPLGGSRKGKIRTYRNIILTFLVSGIWHGANWTFIFWGLIHGVTLCVERALGFNKPVVNKWLIFPRIILTFSIVTLARIFFRLPSIQLGFDVISHIPSLASPYLDPVTFAHIAIALPIVILFEGLMEYNGDGVRVFFSRHCILRWICYLSLTLMILLFGVLNSGQFIYVSF